MTEGLPTEAVPMYLCYSNVDGTVTQKIWLLTHRSAHALERWLQAEPLAEILLDQAAVQAAGIAAIENGAQMFTPLDET